LDRRVHVLTAAPVLAIKRFGAGGYKGASRPEGAHYRSLMAVLPLALVGLGDNVDVGTACALAVEWVAIYSFLLRPSFSMADVKAWRAQVAAWGARLAAWLCVVGVGDGAYIKHHHLLGGHMADALLELGAAANFDAAPFEGRHVTAVKAAARCTSRAVRLAPQLAKRARYAALLETLADEGRGQHENNDSNNNNNSGTGSDGDSSEDDEGDGRALCAPAGAFDVASVQQRMNLDRLVQVTARAI
jgi:hypothetical protein